MMDQNDVFQRLRALSPEQFEVLLVQVGAQDRIAPGALDLRRMALADWVVRGEKQAACLAAIQRVAPTAAADPSEWLRQRRARHGRVTAIGLHDGHATRDLVLDHLFVALDIDWVEHHRVKRHRVGSLQRQALDAAKDLDGALAALRQVRQTQATRGLVLIGPPGSGKTTLLRHKFCVDPTHTCVYLRCWYTKGQRFTRVAQWAEHEAQIDGSAGAGAALLADPSASVTFLLDGFDEVADPDERKALSEWLADEMDRWPNAEWVLSTRGAAWHQRTEHRALDRWLEPFEVLGLTDAAMAELAQRWFQASEALHRHLRDEATADARVAEQTAGLLYAIQKDQADAGLRLYDLATNPLLLTILCVVFQAQSGQRRLPRRRGELYQRCFEVLANRREDLPGFIQAGDLSEVLQPLAWALQHQDGAGGRELPAAEVEALLSEGAVRVGSLSGRAGSELRSYVVERTGLLYDPDGAQLGFIHQTFQEHLASLFADAEGKGRVERVVEQAHHGRWREPILLGQQRQAFRARFWDAVLTTPGRAAALRDLLVACALEHEPDHDAVERHLQSLAPADAEVVLGVLGGPPDRLLRLVPSLEGCLQHGDAAVRRRVAALLGREILPPTLHRVRVAALDMAFVWVGPGSFLMGATKDQGASGYDPEASPDEAPPHRVTFPDGFWIGRFPVTNAQYRRFAAESGAPPGSFRRDGFNHPEQPVTEVSWHEAGAYASWVRRTLHLEADLPTEAEWEYAARGPDSRRFPWVGAPSRARASFDGGTDRPKAPPRVGGLPEGASWCHAEEMAGTVWEWTRSTYVPYTAGDRVHATPPWSGDDTSASSPDTRSSALDGPPRVFRGGSWNYDARWLRSADRLRYLPGNRRGYVGFRLVVRSPVLFEA